jgi:putative phage-type endonuclease
MKNSNKVEWLRERKTYLGGSNLGSIIGINKYETALDVYLEKTSESVEEINNDATYWGNILEDVVAQEYSKRMNLPVEVETKLIRHKEHPFLAANIDRWVGNREYILECKTAGFMMAKDWGEEEFTEDIPESYYAQVAWYSAMTGVSKIDIAVLIGGQKFKIYTYNKDTEFENNLIKAGIDFWQNHVEPRIPPAPSNLDDLKLMYPFGENNKTIKADGNVLELAKELKALKEDSKILDSRMDELKFSIQSFMQDSDTLIDDNNKKIITWKTITGRSSIDSDKLKANYPDAYNDCFKKSNSYRTFICK